MFEAEHTALRTALADLEPDIEHVGSTSVPGLAAKPKIDILVGLRTWGDLASAVERLLGVGYEHEGQIDVPRHLSMKRGRPTTHRVHLVERRGAQWDDVLSFRGALRADPDLRGSYAELKQELALRHRDDHDAYSSGKRPFIEAAIERGRAARRRGAQQHPASVPRHHQTNPNERRSLGRSTPLRLDESGEGSPPAIFVHGSGRAGAAAWPEQIGLSGGRLLFVHLRGFGPTEASTGFDYETDARDLVDLLDEAGSSHLVGASYGGVSALMATMQAEGRVVSLTLIEPILLSIARGDAAVEDLIDRTARALQARSLVDFQRRLEEALGIKMEEPLTEEGRRWLERFKAQRPPWEAAIPRNRLPDMGVPLLVVTGGWSEVYEAIARNLVEDLGARHEVIEGGGHRPQDHPDFDPVLQGWWSEAEARA